MIHAYDSLVDDSWYDSKSMNHRKCYKPSVWRLDRSTWPVGGIRLLTGSIIFVVFWLATTHFRTVQWLFVIFLIGQIFRPAWGFWLGERFHRTTASYDWVGCSLWVSVFNSIFSLNIILENCENCVLENCEFVKIVLSNTFGVLRLSPILST